MSHLNEKTRVYILKFMYMCFCPLKRYDLNVHTQYIHANVPLKKNMHA